MPPARLALILAVAVAAAAGTVALGALVAGWLPPAAIYSAVPVALAAWLLVRLIRDGRHDRVGK